MTWVDTKKSNWIKRSKLEILIVSALFRRLLLVAFLGSVIAISSVAMAAAQAKNLSVTVSGTLSGPNPGQCSKVYANQCSGDNSTACENFFQQGSPKVTGSIGKGDATFVCITLDSGNNVNKPNDLDSNSTCSPIYGEIDTDTGAKPNCFGCDVLTTFNFAGVFCDHQGNSSVGMFEGGYGIEGRTDSAETGWGTLSGTLNNSTGVFSIKLKGTDTP